MLKPDERKESEIPQVFRGNIPVGKSLTNRKTSQNMCVNCYDYFFGVAMVALKNIIGCGTRDLLSSNSRTHVINMSQSSQTINFRANRMSKLNHL